MARRAKSPLEDLGKNHDVREAARVLIEAVQEEWRGRELEPRSYLRAIRELERRRGRPLFHPLLAAGPGRGARVRMADGTTKLDFIGGIGVYAFGHSDTDLIETAVIAAATDTVFQGHLLPGPEYVRLTKALLRHTGKRIRHAWLSLSGSMANENALKAIYQRHAPADRIVVFQGSFAGRTTSMAEISDRPAFRVGLPLRGNVLHVPFYDPDDPDSTEKSVAALDRHLARYPGQVAGMLFELVQGEGGIKTAPREFFEALMKRCHEAEMAVWVDEVQTFIRTGELFAYKTLGLEDYVDVVTAGKSLQGSVTLFSRRYNPKPGLIAGTYAGSTVGMAVASRIIERLEDDGYLGPEGRISVLGGRIDRRFDSLRKRMPRAVGPNTGIGAMHAFVPFEGQPEVAADIIHTAMDEGLMIFGAGSKPSKVRLLPPVNTTDEELEAGFAILEKALQQVAEARELTC